jgi:prephenate dehydrogenase
VRVGVVGVGLIGGSIGLAVRERLDARVSGYDRDAAVLEAARRRGAIDEARATPAETVADADIAFAAVPVSELPRIIDELLAAAPEDCCVTDVGSTKRAIVEGRSDQRFVGGHPLAGAETSGVEHARADLFCGAVWYLTPLSSTSGVLYERLHRALAAIGAAPAAIDPQVHDRVMASVSHLPHVLANVLVAQAAGTLQGSERLPATGPSFRDATRVAGANSAIWTDIYLFNRDALLTGIDEAVSRLGEVRAALAAGNRTAIEAWNEAARADREILLGGGAAGGALHELRASVPNRPGVVADIALALGNAGVNIEDMALAPSPDNSQGVVALWVRGEDAARRAEELIGALEIPVARA